MLSAKIFSNAIKMLIANPVAAIKVSLLPYIILTVIGLAINYALIGDFFPSAEVAEEYLMENSFPFFTSVFVEAVSVFILTAWIAVGWHRFVLLGETPQNLIPAWKTDFVLGYTLKAVWIAVILCFILVPIAVILGLVFGFLLAFDSASGFILFIGFSLGSIVLMALFYRLSLVLPGRAVGKNMNLKESWQQSKHLSTGIWVLSLLIFVLFAVASLPEYFITGNITTSGSIWAILTSWVFTLIGASVLTTLYSVIVEGREIE